MPRGYSVVRRTVGPITNALCVAVRFAAQRFSIVTPLQFGTKDPLEYRFPPGGPYDQRVLDGAGIVLSLK